MEIWNTDVTSGLRLDVTEGYERAAQVLFFTAQPWNMASPRRCKIWELHHSRGTRISKA